MRGEGKRDPRPADSPGRLRQSANAKKQLANLKPFKPGQTGNPEGKNGAKWLSEFRMFFDGPAGNDRSKFYNVCQKLYSNALTGSDAAIRTIIEHMKGKPLEQESRLSVAEHLRRVEFDRISILLKMLGGQVSTMSPDEIVKYLENGDRDSNAFINAAEDIIG